MNLTERVLIRMDTKLREQLERQAESDDRTISNMARLAIKKYINENKND